MIVALAFIIGAALGAAVGWFRGSITTLKAAVTLSSKDPARWAVHVDRVNRKMSE